MATATPDEPGAPKQLLKTERVAQDLFVELLAERSFQKHVIESVVDELMCGGQGNAARSFGEQVLATLRDAARSSAERHRGIGLREDIVTLTKVVSSAIDTFMTSVTFAFCDFGGNLNRERAALFSVRMQVDRFTDLKKFDPALSEQIARRLSALVRAFAAQVATPFQVVNSTFFAISLCDLLYRFEEHCSMYESCAELKNLLSATNRFYTKVVLQLTQLTAARCQAKSRENGRLRTRKASSAARSSAVTLRETAHLLRSPGYLMSADLLKVRTASRKSRAFQVHTDESGQKASRKRKKAVWAKTVHDDMTPCGVTARRLARKLTKDVVDNLACRVSTVLAYNRQH